MDKINEYINQLREDYSRETLDEKQVDSNPIKQFEKWFTEAVDSKVNEPHAMTLATANKEGFPSARIILLRNFDEKGFSFYTNYESRKGEEILENPNGALLFFWQELQRQVRIEGILTKQTEQESDDYFNSRPLESKIGAWTSAQSKVIPNRKALDDDFKRLSEKYKDGNIPRPSHWGGYVLKPVSIEFWQGRPSRLHDRVLYILENNLWKINRLAP